MKRFKIIQDTELYPPAKCPTSDDRGEVLSVPLVDRITNADIFTELGLILGRKLPENELDAGILALSEAFKEFRESDAMNDYFYEVPEHLRNDDGIVSPYVSVMPTVNFILVTLE